MPEIARLTLRRDRRGLIGWAIAFVAIIGISLAFYPSIKGDASFDDLSKNLPDSVKARANRLIVTPFDSRST